MEELLLIIRIFLFAVFILAGIGKLLDLEGAKKAVEEFGVPEDWAEGVAIALPIIEIGFALLLLPLWTAWFGAMGAFFLLAIFIGGMIWQLAKGKAPECHCFGVIHSEPVSKKSLVRNILFALLAFSLVAQGYYNQGLGLTELSIEMAIQLIFGVAFAALLVAVIYYLKKISEQQTQIMRRIEVIELISHEEGREAKRENVNTPQAGLPLGARLPQFELKDLNGRLIVTKDLLEKAKPMLLFFLSPTCTPCKALLPEIEKWQGELKETVDFIIISSGTASENAEKFGGKTFKRILLQNEREVAEMFSTQWTPAALFVNYKGVVGSHPAVGDDAIRELVAKIKNEQPDKLYAFTDKTDGTGVKIGDDVPEFALKDLNDHEVTSKDLRGKPTLLTFWSTTCGFCNQMLKDLQDWERQKDLDEPNLLILSQGRAEDHREIGLRAPVLLDAESKTAEKLGMSGTPSAVLVNENGKIVSEIAVGAPNIWALLGRPTINS